MQRTPQTTTDALKVAVNVPLELPGSPGLEWLAARRIAPSYARLVSIPLWADRLGYGDVVQVRHGLTPGLARYVRTITRGSITAFLLLAAAEEEAEHRHRAESVAYLRRQLVRCGGAGRMIACALPTWMAFTEAVAVLEATPHAAGHSLTADDAARFETDDVIPQE